MILHRAFGKRHVAHEKVAHVDRAFVRRKRRADDRDVAAAVAFLASEEAGFITGEVMDINGGFLMD